MSVPSQSKMNASKSPGGRIRGKVQSFKGWRERIVVDRLWWVGRTELGGWFGTGLGRVWRLWLGGGFGGGFGLRGVEQFE